MECIKAYATVKYKIEKYDEDGKLFEVIEKTDDVTEEQYKTIVDNMGGESNAINN